MLVRFENHLDENPLVLDRQDFGAPDWSFLTRLHNGHTAPESDGNPHYTISRSGDAGWAAGHPAGGRRSVRLRSAVPRAPGVR